MRKKKTSKQQSVSLKDMPIIKLKKGIALKKCGATKRMKNKKELKAALWECLASADVEGFKEILRTHLELVNKDKIAKETGISKRTIFRMLSEEGNPTLENICKLLSKVS